MKTSTTFLALMLFTALPLRAQIVTDGATNTLSNVTNTFSGDVTVGTNGSFTLLVMANNALLTNSVRGVIGHNTTAKSNEVRLGSPSARWLMGNSLFVGSNGAMSRLVVSNGARVENFDGILANSSASSNNVALVTGSGSTWSNRGDLTVGFSGRDNQLLVSNGGFVFNRFGYLGRQPGSSNNVARISGSGSVWSNQFYLTVGGNDRSNRLIVEAGGLVTCSDGIVSGSSSSGNSEVLVTGPGSLWNNRFFLFLGDVAGRNRLVVSNGATVWNGGSIVGTLSPAVSNHVIVTGPGSVWTNDSSLSVGESSSGNRVDVSAGGQLASADGFVGLNAGANNNAVLLTGGGSTWNNLVGLTVGNNGSGNILIASNGASVFSEIGGGIGLNSTAISNTAIVTGSGSRWMGGVQSDFYIGSNSPFNRLIITNGGLVADNGGYLGHETLGRSNLVLVTGSGSLWSNRSSILEMGQRGSGNRLVISNGGAVYSSFFRIGRITGASNEVIVTGPGSSLEVSFFSLRIGEGGSGNRVEINNGASARSPFGEIGADSGSNNEALLTGPGSHWTNSGSFVIGRYGNQGRLIVTNGATFLSGGGMLIGEQTIATNNRVIVDGGTLRAANVSGNATLEVRRGTNLFNAGLMDVDQLLMTNTLGKFEFNGGTLITRGAFVRNGDNFLIGAAGTNRAVWDVRAGVSNTYINDVIRVGSGSSFNQLILTNGNVLTNSESADLGTSLGANSNSAVIAGVGSQWLVGDGLIVGRAGSGNRLVASNGAALVTASISYIGFQSASSNNEAEVTGPGTSWNSGSIYGLRVGYQGHHNRLRITDGALVASALSVIGEFATSSNNLAIVAGAGSLWTNSVEMNVGYAGNGNQLVVSNGAVLADSGHGFIGRDNAARSNAVIVTDPGTRWLITSNLFVGSNGPISLLVISNAARVVNSNAYLGFSVSSSNNAAIISGAGSVWSNRQLLVVGQSGSGNRAMITNGARLDNRFCTLGANVSASNNVLVVTGPGSAWVIEQNFTLGNFGGGNQLVITNGGRVRGSGTIGGFSANNEVVVTGAGSSWTNGSNLNVGSVGSGNRLIIRDGGEVVEQPFDVILGVSSSSTNNRVVVDGGTLRVVNSFSALDVRRGTNVLNAGLIDTGRLVVTNGLGQFEFNGGTLATSATVIGNGRVFTVGNGTSPAKFELRSGTHSFANNLVIANSASLSGNGTIAGVLTVQTGGALSPGASVGKIALSNSPSLQGLVRMEIVKNGSARTNDQLQVSGALTFGGSLVVSNLGPDALTSGDRFQLFSATSYGGAFSNLALPPLPPELTWTNKLALDGSIEVIAYVPPPVTLNIQRSNNFVILSWPTNAADYCLETSFDLTPPVYWQPITGGLTTNGAAFVLSLPNTAAMAKQFFRLAFPCNTASVTLTMGSLNNLVTLNWPSHAFRLETTFNLAPPVSWQTVTNGITSTGAGRTFTFSNSPAVRNQFFRLAFP